MLMTSGSHALRLQLYDDYAAAADAGTVMCLLCSAHARAACSSHCIYGPIIQRQHYNFKIRVSRWQNGAIGTSTGIVIAIGRHLRAYVDYPLVWGSLRLRLCGAFCSRARASQRVRAFAYNI